jgi:hypothetical protein
MSTSLISSNLNLLVSQNQINAMFWFENDLSFVKKRKAHLNNTMDVEKWKKIKR